jgi:hypothetical protein
MYKIPSTSNKTLRGTLKTTILKFGEIKMRWGKDSLRAAAGDYVLRLDSLVSRLGEIKAIIRRIEALTLPQADHDVAVRTFRGLADSLQGDEAAFADGLDALRKFETLMKRATVK